VAREIERKFLVEDASWRACADAGVSLRQAYLCQGERAVVRLRLGGGGAFLTIKSAEAGLSRAEFEYAVPAADARELMQLRQGEIVSKTRFRAPHGGRVWEVDVYDGANAGLVVAEIELESEAEMPELPPWLGREVTGEERYYASRLASQPFCSWPAGTDEGRRER
jgi:adenylate cyclase